MTPSAFRDTVIALFRSSADEASGNLCIPRPLIAFCKGDVSAALVLSQLLYWTDRTEDADGWIAKSYADWEQELGLSEYQIKRVIGGDKRSKGGFAGLRAIGVEVLRRSSKHYGGAPALHYRINRAVFMGCIHDFVQVSKPNNVQVTMPSKPNNVQEAIPNNVQVQYTESTSTETTQKSKRVKRAATPTDWQQLVGFAMDTWNCPSGKATKFAQQFTGKAKGGAWAASNLSPPADLRELKGWRHWIERSGRKQPMTPDWVQESIYEFRDNMAYQDAIRDANDPPPVEIAPVVVPNADRAAAFREIVAQIAAAKTFTPERIAS